MSEQSEPIAIVGTGCRFPGEVTTPSKLWELLKDPFDVTRDIDRFNGDTFYHENAQHHGTSNVRKGYLLSEDVRVFDTQFFNIQPGEADSMDPQQRILLETVYESLETAGIPMEQLQGSSTAVYVGLMTDDYAHIVYGDNELMHTYTSTGASGAIVSNRISYFFDWHGPSMTIDTACSSSMVALHQAMKTLRSGESQVAIAAGANLILTPSKY